MKSRLRIHGGNERLLTWFESHSMLWQIKAHVVQCFVLKQRRYEGRSFSWYRGANTADLEDRNACAR